MTSEETRLAVIERDIVHQRQRFDDYTRNVDKEFNALRLHLDKEFVSLRDYITERMDERKGESNENRTKINGMMMAFIGAFLAIGGTAIVKGLF